MKPAALAPQKHLFVCVNARPPGDPLGPGCSARGESVYTALKSQVAQSGLTARVWVTRTHCLGICPQHGATVAVYPGIATQGATRAIHTEVEPADVARLWNEAGLT